MENKFDKYFNKKDIKWHSYEIGVYHISAVGCGHGDLEPTDHYGPCLRSTYWDYYDPPNRSLETEGNFRMGNILHKKAQKIYKHNNPNSVVEFPVVLTFERDGTPVEIRGSVDLIDFNKKMAIDLKTSSMFSHPTSPYEYNPTYVDQVALYTYMLNTFVFLPKFFHPKEAMITYLKKHNLTTNEQNFDYDWDEMDTKFNEFMDRVFYLHECLTIVSRLPPLAEPQKWCKLCPYLEYCLEHGDLEPVMQKNGKKVKYYVKAK